MKHTIVKYLGHSSWVVQKDDIILAFDYGCIERTNDMRFDFDNVKGKKVFLFFSHSHSDHYDTNFHLESVNHSDVTSILGDFTSKLENTITMRPHEEKVVDNVKVYTLRSTDLGVAFLVVFNHIVVFFAGDHADWGDGDEENQYYYEEIDYIKNLGYQIDIAFIPVCTFNASRPSDMTKGAIYAIDTLNPKISFAMHANGNEQCYNDFLKDYKKNDGNRCVICMEHPGQIWNGEI